MIVMVSVRYEKYSTYYSSYRFIVMQASLAPSKLIYKYIHRNYSF